MSTWWAWAAAAVHHRLPSRYLRRLTLVAGEAGAAWRQPQQAAQEARREAAQEVVRWAAA